MCCILFLCIPAVRNNPVREIHSGNYRDNNSCKYYKSDESFSKVSASSVPGPVSFFNIRFFRFVLRKIHIASTPYYSLLIASYTHCFLYLNADERIISTRSSYPMPASPAAFGSRLVSVIPGIVFTSSTYGCPAGSTLKSTRET